LTTAGYTSPVNALKIFKKNFCRAKRQAVYPGPPEGHSIFARPQK
jgi:hypothetical protein